MGGSINSNRNEKRITVGTRVSGSHGPLVPNSNPSIKRRVKQRIFGVVIESVDTNQYKVKFDNGLEKVCNSRSLRTERQIAGVPISESSPSVVTESITEGEEVLNDVDGLLADSE